jgi:Zn-dependent metalloprotease
MCDAAPNSKSKSDNGTSGTSATNSTKSAVQAKRKISAEQAVALVKKRSDVKKFLALFPGGKSKKTQGFPVVEAEELDNNWNVHVYEQMPDHTATMNWFVVDSQTGAVKPMI